MTDVAVNTCPLKYQKSRSKSAVLVHVPLDLKHQVHDGMAWILYPIYGLYNYTVLMVQNNIFWGVSSVLDFLFTCIDKS